MTPQQPTSHYPTEAERKHEVGMIARALRQYLSWQRELGADGAPYADPDELALQQERIERARYAPTPRPPAPTRIAATDAAAEQPAAPMPGSPPKPASSASGAKAAEEEPIFVRGSSKNKKQERKAPTDSVIQGGGHLYKFTQLTKTKNSTQNHPAPEALSSLQQEMHGCQQCALHKGRRHIVFGGGGANARLVFLGEAPGVKEDREGRPFVSKAGHLLTRMIKAMNLEKSDVYVSHLVKCRPPGNRPTRADELKTCRGFLDRQIAVIKPEVVVVLGEPTAQRLLETDQPIHALRGQWHQVTFGGQKLAVMATFHPEHLLRHPKDKGFVWQDLLKVMEKMGLRPAR